MRSYECLDFEKIEALAATVTTGEELVEKLRSKLKEFTYMRSIPLDFYKIRNLAISAESIEDIIDCLRMDIDLLEEMKADGVILLDVRWEVGPMCCYMCTINPEISEKYGFSEGIWNDEDEDLVAFVVADIREKIDNKFKKKDIFYTYEFVMNLPLEIDTMDRLIAYIQDKIVLLTNMKDDGVYLPEKYVSKREQAYWIEFNTKDPEVAKKYGFEEYGRFYSTDYNYSKYYLCMNLDDLQV